ncbi:MAG: heat shock protein transcriptional repressor HspR [Phycicoccus sp.]
MTPARLPGIGADDDTPVFVISVAAGLAGMHAQTLRQYDRLGLVTPSRTRGGGRRYSPRDVALLREVQRLSQDEGVSLAGIARILELENEVEALRVRVAGLADEVELLRAAAHAEPGAGGRATRVFSVSPSGDVLAARLGERPRSGRSQALVVWRPSRR